VKNEVVDRVLSGQATSDEAKSVACWFEHPQGSMELVQRIDHDLNQEWDKRYAASARGSLRHWLYRVACVLVIVVCSLACGYSVYHHYIQPIPVSQQLAYAARGERTQLVLQDGTHIFLNSQSQITFPSRFNLRERRVRLNGEAYFEVAKNPHRPFIVEINNAEVTVLGTRFNAKSYANEPVKVMLDEGSVRFSAPNIEDVTLEPGEMVSYDVEQAIAQVTKTQTQMASAWMNHRIDVDNMSLAELTGILERHYDVTFHVHSPKCYRHSFTLSMDDGNLREVINRMDYLSPLTFKYSEKNKTIEVY